MTSPTGRPDRRPGAAAPVWTAWFGSLVLSAIAVGGSSVLNRDGMLYVDAARAFIAHDYAALLGSFDWPLLPLLIAGLGSLSGLDLETAGHVIGGLLLAGACALMVDLVRRHCPGDTALAWAACLVVLAMPGYNDYRDQLLREHGYWCFSVLAFWLALRWARAGGGWRGALPCQLALVAAMLFRFEAVVFFLALIAWQIAAAPVGARARRVASIAALPIVTVLLLAALAGAGAIDWPARVLRYLDAANLLGARKWSAHVADLANSGILPKYSRHEAGTILFFGVLALIPIKFVKMLGAFLVPFVYPALAGGGGALLRRWALLAWAFLAHGLALMLFASDMLFLSSRYVSMLTLLVVPMVAAGLLMLLGRWPRWRWPIVGIALATMVANVLSLAPGRAHVAEAGAWLAAHAPDPARVYTDDPRVAYYAGWGYAGRKHQLLEPQALEQAVAAGKFAMLALSESRRSPWVDNWLAARGGSVASRFDNGAGESIVIVRPPPAFAQPPAMSNERPAHDHPAGSDAE